MFVLRLLKPVQNASDHSGQMTDLQHVFLWYEMGFVGQVR